MKNVLSIPDEVATAAINSGLKDWLRKHVPDMDISVSVSQDGAHALIANRTANLLYMMKWDALHFTPHGIIPQNATITLIGAMMLADDDDDDDDGAGSE